MNEVIKSIKEAIARKKRYVKDYESGIGSHKVAIEEYNLKVSQCREKIKCFRTNKKRVENELETLEEEFESLKEKFELGDTSEIKTKAEVLKEKIDRA